MGEIMDFDDDFIKSLPEDPFDALPIICNKFFETSILLPRSDTKAQYDLAQEACAFITIYSDIKELKLKAPVIGGDPQADTKVIVEFITKVRKDARRRSHQSQYERYKNIFGTKFGKVFHFEFSEGDLKLIQELINELRDLISTTEELEEGHKHRLIKKLEKVQSELHKSVSDLDRFWGFCVDLSLVVGMMGENAKPTVDLVKKIVDIIWPAQTRAYELSSSLPFKMLGQAEDDKSENGKS